MKTEHELLKYRNLCETSLKEIKTKLGQLGLGPGMIFAPGLVDPAGPPPPETQTEKLQRELREARVENDRLKKLIAKSVGGVLESGLDLFVDAVQEGFGDKQTSSTKAEALQEALRQISELAKERGQINL